MTQEEPIPQVRLENSEVWDEIAPQLKELVKRGAFTLGEELERLEVALADWAGCRWCVGVSSGTAALLLSLRAAPLHVGARVAIPANTFFATFEAVVAAGHHPVVIDHDEDYLISLDALRELDPEVDAVIPVHLYGLPVDMTSLMSLAREHGWWVLEDACQAHGATCGSRMVGSFGHAGAFSAYPTKNLGAWGDAGFVTGSDEDLHASIRAMRHHSQVAPNAHVSIGGTDRMDNLQAVVLLAKLARLEHEISRRREVAEWYRQDLADRAMQLPHDRGQRTHVFHQFVVRVPQREHVRKVLADHGIGTGIHYPTPVHLQAGALGACSVPERPTRAESWAAQILSLPMYPSLQRAEVRRVVDVLTSTLEKLSSE